MAPKPSSRKGIKTRRRRGGGSKSKPLSIPELKHSFDELDAGVREILKSGAAAEQQTKKFQKLWQSIFHRPVPKEAAESYLAIKRSAPVAPPKANTTRKMKGGAAPIAGAPLDYMTRPGVDGTYGSFPAYQTSGLAFYDKINQEGMYQECGIKDFTAKVPANMGSNLAGGGARAKSHTGGALSDVARVAINRPFAPSVPPSVGQDVQDYFAGKQLGPSPDPSESKLKYI